MGAEENHALRMELANDATHHFMDVSLDGLLRPDSKRAESAFASWPKPVIFGNSLSLRQRESGAHTRCCYRYKLVCAPHIRQDQARAVGMDLRRHGDRDVDRDHRLRL